MTYKIHTKHAKMPSRCYGASKYYTIELQDSDGSVVYTWDKVHKGKTNRSAYAVALKEATAFQELFNNPFCEIIDLETGEFSCLSVTPENYWDLPNQAKIVSVSGASFVYENGQLTKV